MGDNTQQSAEKISEGTKFSRKNLETCGLVATLVIALIGILFSAQSARDAGQSIDQAREANNISATANTLAQQANQSSSGANNLSATANAVSSQAYQSALTANSIAATANAYALAGQDPKIGVYGDKSMTLALRAECGQLKSGNVAGFIDVYYLITEGTITLTLTNPRARPANIVAITATSKNTTGWGIAGWEGITTIGGVQLPQRDQPLTIPANSNRDIVVRFTHTDRLANAKALTLLYNDLKSSGEVNGFPLVLNFILDTTDVTNYQPRVVANFVPSPSTAPGLPARIDNGC